jgi:hypothetical protein
MDALMQELSPAQSALAFVLALTAAGGLQSVIRSYLRYRARIRLEQIRSADLTMALGQPQSDVRYVDSRLDERGRVIVLRAVPAACRPTATGGRRREDP